MTDRAEVEWLIEDTKRVLEDQKKHGGIRPGAGRPPHPRKKGEKQRAVWIYATDAEMKKVKQLSPEDRKLALLSACAIDLGKQIRNKE